MEPNPDEVPTTPSEPIQRFRFRIPWLLVGLGIGSFVMMLLLPTVSDSTGSIQTNVILGSLIFGAVLGFILDAVNQPAAS